ncbi:hypothetical protein Y1Q_0016506 [Alligator mississippiensis]|uniref:Uncharacterized protein n=1 Tax=Alligator mississippiensis TaxID=8496 RepID=A0A151N328_ALLMI|nr:hypothetical protein Y1Q_0016506 [Alligator mississippiensis]
MGKKNRLERAQIAARIRMTLPGAASTEERSPPGSAESQTGKCRIEMLTCRSFCGTSLERVLPSNLLGLDLS